MTYILYKSPIQSDTLWIVRFLHSLGEDAKPVCVLERNHPSWVVDLPSISDLDGERYVGFDNCVVFFEKKYGISHLLQRTAEFRSMNPEYKLQH